MSEKILFVDDNPNLLEAIKRQLRKKFSIDTALNGEQGLLTMADKGPYAVVVSDMQMPGMDGVQFLSKVREAAPDTVRVMLTGMAEINTAIEAVNEGRIFRFLSKPCDTETIAKTLLAGLEQYRLVKAEKELLEKTLSRSIKVLVDILSLVNPVAFSRTTRLRKYVKHMTAATGLPNAWQFELAAMLSQIGCVTLPQETLEKVYAKQALTDHEKDVIASHPSTGCNLLVKIPRLELVARMIEKQMEPFSAFSDNWDKGLRDQVELGAQVLKVAIELDQLVVGGTPHKAAVEKLLERPGECNSYFVSTLRDFKVVDKNVQVKLVSVKNLSTDMIIAESIWTKNGVLLIPAGQEITYLTIKRIRNFLDSGSIPEQIRVSIPV